MSMPPGYRFFPTDFELIHYYLLNKIMKRPNLIDGIKDVELYNSDPRTLAELGEKWYFFSPRNRKYPNGKRPSRHAGDGYWKPTGADKEVLDEDHRVIGHKKTLVYYRGTNKNGVKTHWIMHEYIVVQPPRARDHARDMKLNDWVLCRIYERESRKLKAGVDESSSGGEREDNMQQQHHHQGSGSYGPNGGDLFFNEAVMADWDSIHLSSLLWDLDLPTKPKGN